ncbi:hypothetical protein Tco_0949232, partial [Tanacetum coccineum]
PQRGREAAVGYMSWLGSKARGNHQNQVVWLLIGDRGHGNNDNQERGRAFMLGAEEACQDPNIVMGTFTLNNHYATTLFDSSADNSFVSTTFIPLLGMESNTPKISTMQLNTTWVATS